MNLETILEKYGLPGIFIIALIVALKWGAGMFQKMLADHKAERDEWKKSNERLQDDANKNIRENTNVLSGLKTLLENRK